MSPAISTTNMGNSWATNLKSLGDNLMGAFFGIQASNLKNVFILEMRSAGPFSAWNQLRAFSHTMIIALQRACLCYLVGNVVVIVSFPEMVGITARWVVAFMQYVLGRPVSRMKVQGQPMRCDRSVFAGPKATIAATNFCTKPNPAISIWAVTFRFIHKGPKSFNFVVIKNRWDYIDVIGHLKLFLSGLFGVVWAVIHSSDLPYFTLNSIQVNNLIGGAYGRC